MRLGADHVGLRVDPLDRPLEVLDVVGTQVHDRVGIAGDRVGAEDLRVVGEAAAQCGERGFTGAEDLEEGLRALSKGILVKDRAVSADDPVTLQALDPALYRWRRERDAPADLDEAEAGAVGEQRKNPAIQLVRVSFCRSSQETKPFSATSGGFRLQNISHMAAMASRTSAHSAISPPPAPSRQSEKDLAWGRRYLMCPPDYFDVVYSINPWMNTRVAVDRLLAHTQWSSLVKALEDAGARVEVIEARPGLPDMVFTANAGMVVGDSFVPALMRHRERQGERRHFEAWFAAHGFRVRPLPGDVLQEGTGDALPFGGVLVAGYRTRSTAEAYIQLARSLGTATVAVELRDARYYHVDLTFCPLDAHRAMLVPWGWTEEGLAAIAEIVPEPLVLRKDEAAALCANSVVVDRTVIMPACPPRLRRQLERCGFAVVVVEVSEFIKAGGAVRCLTLPLDIPASALSVPATATAASPPRADLRAVRVTTLGSRANDGERAHEIDDQREASEAREAIELADTFGAHNYHPLNVVIERAAGAWVYDREGRPYLDALAAYSALNFGHRHHRLLTAAQRQLERLTLTSRAFHNDQFGPFCRDLAQLCSAERVLPMNTGAEAVETAIKVARKWGYERERRPEHAKIVVCEGNFHGRTVTIVSCSQDSLARDGFGPFTPGFERVPYGDLEALAAALADEDVVAFLVEPIQGEAGVIVPPAGYLRGARELCSERGVLLIADEIQSGLGRTGTTFACEHEQVKPDVYVLGKALGGGIMPLSAVVSSDEVLGVLRPGEHGSTFGGNPLACAIGREVVAMLASGQYQRRAARLGAWFLGQLRDAGLPGVAAIRGRGLWFGIELQPDALPARAVCERLLQEGVLAKETYERTVRLAPPLVVGKQDLQWALAGLKRALDPLENSAG